MTKNVTVVKRGVSVAELTEMYPISQSTIRNAIRAGQLKVIRLGRKIIITLSAAEEWLGHAK
jgi:excisionase family DNA binding protein